MPNRYQLVFLGSFAVVFASLFFLSSLISTSLKLAGIRVADIILIGLPKNPNFSEPDASNTQALPMADFTSNTYAQLIALALATLTSAFIYFKFAATSEFRQLYSIHTAGFS